MVDCDSCVCECDQQLRGLTESWALLQRMREERPALRERHTLLKKGVTDAQRQVTDARADVKAVGEREDAVRELLKVATEITRQHSEMVDLLKGIKHVLHPPSNPDNKCCDCSLWYP
jgi:predicted  nucleic acid-binding Zn-ribbon protein